jgi:hypothetical protein
MDPDIFRTVAKLATEILKMSCAKLVTGPKEILRGHISIYSLIPLVQRYIHSIFSTAINYKFGVKYTEQFFKERTR